MDEKDDKPLRVVVEDVEDDIPIRVVVTDVNIEFFSILELMLKVAVALVPVAFMLALINLFMGFLSSGV